MAKVDELFVTRTAPRRSSDPRGSESRFIGPRGHGPVVGQRIKAGSPGDCGHRPATGHFDDRNTCAITHGKLQQKLGNIRAALASGGLSHNQKQRLIARKQRIKQQIKGVQAKLNSRKANPTSGGSANPNLGGPVQSKTSRARRARKKAASGMMKRIGRHLSKTLKKLWKPLKRKLVRRLKKLSKALVRNLTASQRKRLTRERRKTKAMLASMARMESSPEPKSELGFFRQVYEHANLVYHARRDRKSKEIAESLGKAYQAAVAGKDAFDEVKKAHAAIAPQATQQHPTAAAASGSYPLAGLSPEKQKKVGLIKGSYDTLKKLSDAHAYSDNRAHAYLKSAMKSLQTAHDRVTRGLDPTESMERAHEIVHALGSKARTSGVRDPLHEAARTMAHSARYMKVMDRVARFASSKSPQSVAVLAGRLYLSSSGWGLLKVPNGLIRGLFDAIHEPGVILPPHDSDLPRKQWKLNAHISILRPDEIEKLGGSQVITEWGHHFHYQLGPVKKVEPAGWDGMKEVYFVDIDSPELEEFRAKYGLSRLPNKGKFRFHASIAVKPKYRGAGAFRFAKSREDMSSKIRSAIRGLNPLCPDYGYILLNTKNNDVWIIGSDSDDREAIDPYIDSIEDIPGIGKVTLEAEYIPKEIGSWVKPRSPWVLVGRPVSRFSRISRFPGEPQAVKAGSSGDCGHRVKGGLFAPGNTCADGDGLNDGGAKPVGTTKVKGEKGRNRNRIAKGYEKQHVPDEPKNTRISELAKKSHNPTTWASQEHAKRNEFALAKDIGGTAYADNHPQDIDVEVDGKNHHLELKSVMTGKHGKLKMSSEAMGRKIALKRKTGNEFHTVAIDDRNVYNGGVNKHLHSGNRLYYKRGIGNYRVSKMHPVKDAEELKRLIATPTARLPELARGIYRR